MKFTDEQRATLQALFPEGVCDYRKPAVERQATVVRQTYERNNGNVIYGGGKLSGTPENAGEGWASSAFFAVSLSASE